MKKISIFKNPQETLYHFYKGSIKQIIIYKKCITKYILTPILLCSLFLNYILLFSPNITKILYFTIIQFIFHLGFIGSD